MRHRVLAVPSALRLLEPDPAWLEQTRWASSLAGADTSEGGSQDAVRRKEFCGERRAAG